MKKKIVFLLVSCLVSFKAMANIGIFPTAIDFPENSRKRSQTLTIINESKEPQTYRVSMIEYGQDENGKYVKTETVTNSAQKYLIYSPKQFTLMPGDTQDIRVARKGMGDAKDGEYVSHLLVSEVEMPHMKNSKNQKDEEAKSAESEEGEEGEEKKISISIHTLFSTSIPVTIYKGNQLSQATEIVSYRQNGDKLDFVLQRKGNVSSRIKIKVFNDKGEEIGHSGMVRIYTPNGKRNLTIDLKAGTKPYKLELDDVLTKKKLMEKVL